MKYKKFKEPVVLLNEPFEPNAKLIRQTLAKHSQGTRANEIMSEYRLMYQRLDSLQNRLMRLLDEAQNRPPQGASDGTITETEYNRLRITERRTRDLLTAIAIKGMTYPVNSEDDSDELP